jgi:hypothetical protein
MALRSWPESVAAWEATPHQASARLLRCNRKL